MRVTFDEIKNLPDGTKFKVFLSGGCWGSDFGKVQNVIKFDNKLYNIGDFFDINEMDDKDGYEFEVAINEYEDSNKLFLSDKESTVKHDSCIHSPWRSYLV